MMVYLRDGAAGVPLKPCLESESASSGAGRSRDARRGRALTGLGSKPEMHLRTKLERNIRGGTLKNRPIDRESHLPSRETW